MLHYKRLICLLPSILFFLPAFAFFVPFLNSSYPIFYILLYTIIGFVLFFNRMSIFKFIKKLSKYTALKYFLLFLLLISINSIILSFFHVTTFARTFRSIITYIFLLIIPILIYFTYVIDKYIKLKFFIRFFIILLWLNLLLGFITFIGQVFDISFIQTLIDIFSNKRIIDNSLVGYASQQESDYMVGNLLRLRGLFEEPSHYAKFLFIFLPWIYNSGNTKLKISNNKKLNILIKKTIIPFSWITIILTLSPIFLILSILLTIIYYQKTIILILKKNIFLIYVVPVLLSPLLFINLSETYLSRVINVLGEVKSFNDFVLIEPSLATRIISYVNSFCIFLKNPFGVGFGNLGIKMYEQYFSSPVPLTMEIIAKTQKLHILDGRAFYNSNFIYSILAEHGFICTSILIFYFYKVFQEINIYLKKLPNTSYYHFLLKNIHGSFIAITILAFYSLSMIDNYLYVFVALSSLVIFYCKRERI